MSTASYDYDLIVLGGGSAGLAGAIRAAQHGKRVAMLEPGELGGTCVNVGCVPKKAMWLAADLHERIGLANAMGFDVEARPALSWKELVIHRQAYISNIHTSYHKRLDETGVVRIPARGHLLDAHTVACSDGVHYSAEHILIATGAHPLRPDIPGAELGLVSDDFFDLRAAPAEVAIIGGGYIAVEFAGIMNGLGADVSLIYRGPLFLRGFDQDLRATLAGEMVKRGVDLCFNTDVDRLEEIEGGGIRVCGPTGEESEVDLVLWATGRVPNTEGLRLGMAGVTLGNNGQVAVDEYSRTSVENIYAVGDCTDRVALTPVAIAEAMALVETLNGNPTAMDYGAIPSAVFSQPPIGTVGLTESEARNHCREVMTYRSVFRPMQHTLAGRDEHTMMKLVVDGATDEVLGIHMVGPDAGEIIQGFAVAMKCGATKAQFDATVGIHPTAAEEFVTMREPVED